MGALMISLDCHHPDLIEFIDCKTKPEAVTKANISVKVTNDFMNAVVNDEDWVMAFTRPETGETITRKEKAKVIFDKLCENNWNWAEPGVLFWDRIENWNLLSTNKEFEYAGVNPCAEEPLPAGGSCLLGSINLTEFVDEDGYFDFLDFVRTVKIAVRYLNVILDEGLTLHPLEEQRNSVRDWRQIGLGVMGIADMLIKARLSYNTEDARALCDNIASLMAQAAIEESENLAEEYGAYPKFNEDVFNSPFYVANSNGNRKPLRNSQLLTIAPTGTISTMLGVSGGIEPIFANSYTRKTQSLHGHDEYYKVYTPIVEKYMKAHNISDESDLPDFFVTSANIPPFDRIAMQSVWQRHIDASISSTVNLPNEATVNEVREIYMNAWAKGLKGITVYRAGCKREGVLTVNSAQKQPKSTELERGEWKQKPDDTLYYLRKLRIGCGDLKLFIGWSSSEQKIQDLYVIKSGEGGCERLEQSTAITMSAILRLGGTLENIEKAFRGVGTCSSFANARAKGKKLSRGNSCGMVIFNAMKDFEAEMLRKSKTVTSPVPNSETARNVSSSKEQGANNFASEKCPECGGELRYEGGCVQCPECGWSKCN